jgi:hypothetical protein
MRSSPGTASVGVCLQSLTRNSSVSCLRARSAAHNEEQGGPRDAVRGYLQVSPSASLARIIGTPEPSLATLMGPPGSPWSLSAPINHVTSIEQSAAWPSRSSAVSQEGGQARGPPFLQVVRTGLALRSDERLPSRCRRAGSGSTGSRTRPSQGQQHDAAPRRSLHGPCVCPRTSSPASSAHDVRANSA